MEECRYWSVMHPRVKYEADVHASRQEAEKLQQELNKEMKRQR